MFNEENSNNTCGDNESIRRAINKIKQDSKFKPICCIGPVGPTGPTGRLFKSSNRIIIDSS